MLRLEYEVTHDLGSFAELVGEYLMNAIAALFARLNY